jgi:hypothetical protein
MLSWRHGGRRNRLRKTLLAALCGTVLSVTHAAAENAVAQAVQKLHLSPQQLLSLRDFLGPFNRGTDVESSGAGLFVLRDARSMAYTGEFSLRVSGDGSLQVDRVSGPATLDSAHDVRLPLRLDAKSRAQVMVALAGSQLLVPRTATAAPLSPSPMANASTAPLPLMPNEEIAGVNLTDAKATGSITQSRAVFFRDGSGLAHTVRTQLASSATPTPAPLRIADRYYSAIQSDRTRAWRSSLVEIDTDVQIAFADFELRYACPMGAACRPRGPAPASNGLHLIRWGRQLIAAVPSALMAQMAAPAGVPPASPPGAVAQPSAPQDETAPPAATPTSPPAEPPSQDAVPSENPSGR